MITVIIRRQGGVAIVTIPSKVMKSLGVSVGAQLDVSIVNGTLNARPRSAPTRKRYTLDELLVGSTPKAMRALIDATALGHDGDPSGASSDGSRTRCLTGRRPLDRLQLGRSRERRHCHPNEIDSRVLSVIDPA